MSRLMALLGTALLCGCGAGPTSGPVPDPPLVAFAGPAIAEGERVVLLTQKGRRDLDALLAEHNGTDRPILVDLQPATLDPGSLWILDERLAAVAENVTSGQLIIRVNGEPLPDDRPDFDAIYAACGMHRRVTELLAGARASIGAGYVDLARHDLRLALSGCLGLEGAHSPRIVSRYFPRLDIARREIQALLRDSGGITRVAPIAPEHDHILLHESKRYPVRVARLAARAEMVRRQYALGRLAYDRRDYPKACGHFGGMLRVLEEMAGNGAGFTREANRARLYLHVCRRILRASNTTQ